MNTIKRTETSKIDAIFQNVVWATAYLPRPMALQMRVEELNVRDPHTVDELKCLVLSDDVKLVRRMRGHYRMEYRSNPDRHVEIACKIVPGLP